MRNVITQSNVVVQKQKHTETQKFSEFILLFNPNSLVGFVRCFSKTHTVTLFLLLYKHEDKLSNDRIFAEQVKAQGHKRTTVNVIRCGFDFYSKKSNI